MRHLPFCHRLTSFNKIFLAILIFLQILWFRFALELTKISLSVCTTFSLSIHKLKRIWVSSIFKLLWIEQQKSWLNVRNNLTSPLGTCQGVIELCYMGDLHLVFWEVSSLSSKLDAPVCNPIKSKWGFLFPYITNSICFQVFSIYFISFVHINVLYMYSFFIFSWFFKFIFVDYTCISVPGAKKWKKKVLAPIKQKL